MDLLAREWVATRPSVDDRCVRVSVLARSSAQVATALGSVWDPARDGPRPHVWLPESSLWLSVAGSRPDAAGVLPGRSTSIASSPVVLAVRQPLAQALGWPQRSPSWTDLVGALNRPDSFAAAGHPEWAALRLGVTDPSRSTPGLAAVLSILDQGASGTVGDDQLVAGLSLLRVIGALAPDTADFFAALDPTAPVGPNSAVAAFPALEQAVASYNADDPAVPLVPLYDRQRPVVADYPYTILTGGWVSAAERSAAEQFRDYLLTPAAQQVLSARGLRAPDRTTTSSLLPVEAGFATNVAPPRATPDAASLSRVIAEWINLQRRVNLLAVLDTSGSMNNPVAGTGLTRLQLLQQTYATGFSLLPDTMSVGLWDFSVRPGSSSERRELVPFGPLPGSVGSLPRRQALVQSVAQLRADGYTPLYNTIYAAFHTMQQHWQPGSTNSVLLITDGANELDGGLSLTELLSRLEQEQRPDRPVQIVSIAVGEQADAAALEQISNVTGGRTVVVRDPATAVQTLVLAFTGRLQ